jgi:hypothetical protein
MNIGNKQELKKKLQDQSANNPKTEPPHVSLTAAFKDLPIEARVAALAELGIQVSPQSLVQQDMMKNPPKQPPIQQI